MFGIINILGGFEYVFYHKCVNYVTFNNNYVTLFSKKGVNFALNNFKKIKNEHTQLRTH